MKGNTKAIRIKFENTGFDSTHVDNAYSRVYHSLKALGSLGGLRPGN